jgi:TolB-like protein/class 3 adenylate cyclase/Tfp pilus assembly protein PilF
MTTSPVSRVLTLVFTDLADSTALKTQHGDVAGGDLIARHREHVTRLAAEGAGSIVDWAGDGCFLTFDTASAAVVFALRLQQIHKYETDLPGVRAGIHLGEVTVRAMNETMRVEGLIVDLTARVSGLARAGQVLVSGAVQQSAKQRLGIYEFGQPIRWENYGPYTLKGFDEAVEIREAGLEKISPFEAPKATEKAWPKKESPAGKDATASASDKLIRKIAVLPFTNISDAPDQEWFVDGMTETLIAELAKIKALTVISRTSVMHYKKTTKPLRQIAQELGVQALVEGSAMRAGNRVRITAQLIDANADAHLWAERYDGTMEEILDLQSDVALAIAKQVNVVLTPEEAAPLKRSRLVNPAAFDVLMKSKYALSAPTPESFDHALRHIQEALSIDPEYAEAFAFRAAMYAQSNLFASKDQESAYFQARISAQESIRLGGESATALSALANVARFVEWDWDRALEYAKRALALSPGDPLALSVSGAAYTNRGEFSEAHRYYDRAIAADPLDPAHYTRKGAALIAERRFDDAIAFGSDEAKRFSTHPWSKVNITAAYLNKGLTTEACRVAEDFAAMQAGLAPFASLPGICYALSGRAKDAESALDILLARQKAETNNILCAESGILSLALGRMDEAYPLLEKSYHERNFTLLWLNIVHVFELFPFPLDERIKRLFARMKIASSPW